jgi:Protein of unknown function (DUF2804)
VTHRRHATALAALPHRGRFGDPRPPALADLPLPPAAMPSRFGARPLKAWRYIGAFSPELMACVATVRIGRARQSFWAIWDRRHARLHERTAIIGGGGVRLGPASASVRAAGVRIDLVLREQAGIESVCRSGDAYVWTRKQGAVAVSGTVALPGRPPAHLHARAVIDDTAGYHERHTHWRWSAGVGRGRGGERVGWNLVAGVNDAPRGSERAVWIDGEPFEPGPVAFAPELSSVRFAEGGELRFEEWAAREDHTNLLLVRSSYRQPFGAFSGSLPGGVELATGFGVMEEHDARW